MLLAVPELLGGSSRSWCLMVPVLLGGVARSEMLLADPGAGRKLLARLAEARSEMLLADHGVAGS